MFKECAGMWKGGLLSLWAGHALYDLTKVVSALGEARVPLLTIKIIITIINTAKQCDIKKTSLIISRVGIYSAPPM